MAYCTYNPYFSVLFTTVSSEIAKFAKAYSLSKVICNLKVEEN